MIYFLLPRLSFQNYQHIDYITMDQTCIPPVNSLSHYLYDIKERINTCQADWDMYKKITNPYEYIHSPIYQKKKCIANYKPLSRSFFKMIELSFFLKSMIDDINPINTFHLAEGPGGFIEAIAHLRKNKEDTYTGMTILSDENDQNIPAWKKSAHFLKENPNVNIETGQDGTGNILSFTNYEYCKEKYKSSMDIITGDGGFDFSVDFNKQEINIANLLFAQIAFALVMQKPGGMFVLKIFDCFMQHTIELLAILASFYEHVYITKPQTSRYANSEKYIVCLGFIRISDNFMIYLDQAFKKMSSITALPLHFLNSPIPHLFLMKVDEYNSIFGQQQIENIHYTLSLIENRFKTDKIDNLIKQNVQKCIQWCIKHSVPYNNIPTNINIFLSDDIDTSSNTVRRQSAFIR
jgi:23S rRNA U2552 (ribose-2'-O)-methylase RlmE/FtsJ